MARRTTRQDRKILTTAALALACGSGTASSSAPGSTASGADIPELPAPPAALIPIAADLAHVCQPNYSGAPFHASFDPRQSGPHLLLFIAADGSAHSWNNVVPEAWRPTTAEDVELVACVGELEREAVETCEYLGTSGEITRFQRKASVSLVAPRSAAGTLHTLRGPTPDACPSSTADWEDITGPPPEPATAKSEIVDRYVLLPTCGESRPLASCLQCWRDAEEATPSGCGFGGGLQSSETLPNARTGEPIALDWHWEVYPDGLVRGAAAIDWSTSPDAASLTSLQGEHTSFLPTTARAYSFLATARLPPDATGLVVQTRSYGVEALDRPVIEDLLGTTEPALVRVGQPSRFSSSIRGRPTSGRFGEATRWTWIERPSGSTALDPTFEPASALWSFVPDLPGTYRVQLEYSDGVGFSAPVTSAPITAITAPIVTGLVDRTAAVGTPTRLEGTATHAVGFPAFRWTLIQIPAGSSLTPTYYDSVDTNSLIFIADVAGAYRFEVIVTDSSGASDPIEFTVTAS